MSDLGPKNSADGFWMSAAASGRSSGRCRGPDLKRTAWMFQSQTSNAQKKYVRSRPEKFGGRVLDVGCGVGQVVGALQRAGFEAHGVDVSEPNIERAKKICPISARKVRRTGSGCRLRRRAGRRGVAEGRI